MSAVPLGEELQERVQEYKKLGLNPLALATGCAVKVDLVRVVYPALKELRAHLERIGLEIAPREDAEVVLGGQAEVHRRFYPLGEEAQRAVNPQDIANIDPATSVTVVQIYQRYADKPESFAKFLKPVYEGIARSSVYLGRKLRIGKGHSIVTPFREDQFVMFDFIKIESKSQEVLTAINNDTIHVIDPSEEPGDERQIKGAISNALNDIFVLGVHKNISVVPVVNAPKEELRERILNGARRFAGELGFKLLDAPRPPKGRLLLGATVLGETDRKPPMFEELARPGMSIIVTRPFGELAPLNVFITYIIDETIAKDLKEYGITLDELVKAKNKAFDTIATPNTGAARAIYRHLPEIGEEPDPESHIILTTDITGPGFYVFQELAEKMRASIQIHDIPLLFPEFSEFATKNFIMPNATAGTNGAFVIVCHKNIEESVLKDLQREGLNPRVIGEIEEVAVEPKVKVTRKLEKYIADRSLLSVFKLV